MRGTPIDARQSDGRHAPSCQRSEREQKSILVFFRFFVSGSGMGDNSAKLPIRVIADELAAARTATDVCLVVG
jgi:hypothetical protein